MIKLLTFIFLIHVGSLTAQLNFQYFNQETLGTQIKFDVTAAYNQSVMNKMLLGYDNLFVVTYSHNSTSTYSANIEVFDKSLKKIKQSKYSPQVKNKKAYVVGAFVVNEKPALLLAQSGTSEKVSIYLKYINSAGEVDTNVTLVETIEGEEADKGFALKALSMKNHMSIDKQNFNTVVSENGNYLGLFFRNGSLASKGSQIFLLVIDNKLNKWSKSFKTEFNYIDWMSEEMTISNDGQFVYGFSEKKQKDNLGIPVSRVHYGIYLSKTDSKLVSYDELLGKKYIFEAKPKFDKDNVLNYFYSYLEKSNSDEIEGFGIAKMKNSSIILSNKTDYTLDKKSLKQFNLKSIPSEFRARYFQVGNDNLVLLEGHKRKSLMGSMYKMPERFLNQEEKGSMLQFKPISSGKFDLKEFNKEPFINNMVELHGTKELVFNNETYLIFNSVDKENFNKQNQDASVITKLLDFKNSEITNIDKDETSISPLSINKVSEDLYFGVSYNYVKKKFNYVLVSKGVPQLSSKTQKVTQKQENNSSQTSMSSPANTSAIAHGEARTPSAAVAKTYKYKADEKSVEYYNELRKKFEEEEKVRKEKEALIAIEKAKKEEEMKQGRRLSEDQAPQFDKYRQGEKTPIIKKTTAEEDYKALFK